MMRVTAHLKTDNNGNVHLSVQQSTSLYSTTSNFIQWEIDEGQAEVPVHIATMCFLPHCTLGRDVVEGDGTCVSCLMFNLTERAWSRVLSTLTEAGIFSESLKSEYSLSVKMASTSILHSNP